MSASRIDVSFEKFLKRIYIRLSEKFLSFYEEIIDAQRLLFYIILSNFLGSVLFC